MSEAVDTEGDVQRDGEPHHETDDEAVHQGLVPAVPGHPDRYRDVQQRE